MTMVAAGGAGERRVETRELVQRRAVRVGEMPGEVDILDDERAARAQRPQHRRKRRLAIGEMGQQEPRVDDVDAALAQLERAAGTKAELPQPQGLGFGGVQGVLAHRTDQRDDQDPDHDSGGSGVVDLDGIFTHHAAQNWRPVDIQIQPLNLQEAHSAHPLPFV